MPQINIADIIDSQLYQERVKMAHRSIIGIEYPDNNISAIYVMKGGIPSDNSAIQTLAEHYSSTEAMEQIIRFSETNGLKMIPSSKVWEKHDSLGTDIYNWELLPEKISFLANETLGCLSRFWYKPGHHQSLPRKIEGDLDYVSDIADTYCCEYIYLWLSEENRWKAFEIRLDDDHEQELFDISQHIANEFPIGSSVEVSNIEDSVSASIEHIKTEYSEQLKPRTSRDAAVRIQQARFALREAFAEEMTYIVKALIPRLEKEPRAKQLLAETSGGLDEEIEPYDFEIIMDIGEKDVHDTDLIMYFIEDLVDEHGIEHFIYVDIIPMSKIKLRPPEQAAWTRNSLASE